ncbi:MAG: VOC family protein [bacterium]
MNVEPCFYFQGQCEQAMDFYREVLSAEVLVVRMKDNPSQQHVRPGTEQKILRAGLKIGSASVLMSDGHNAGKPTFQGFSLNLTVDGQDRAKQLYESLATGGEIRIPLQETPSSPAFGTVVDKFGVLWVISAKAQSSQGAA